MRPLLLLMIILSIARSLLWLRGPSVYHSRSWPLHHPSSSAHHHRWVIASHPLLSGSSHLRSLCQNLLLLLRCHARRKVVCHLLAGGSARRHARTRTHGDLLLLLVLSMNSGLLLKVRLSFEQGTQLSQTQLNLLRRLESPLRKGRRGGYLSLMQLVSQRLLQILMLSHEHLLLFCRQSGMLLTFPPWPMHLLWSTRHPWSHHVCLHSASRRAGMLLLLFLLLLLLLLLLAWLTLLLWHPPWSAWDRLRLLLMARRPWLTRSH